MMRSARDRTTSILCSTSSTVLSFCPFISWIRSRITGTSSTLMPAVGSSNMKMAGSNASRTATSSFRWSPCGNPEATVAARGERAGLEAAADRVDGDVAAEADGQAAGFQDRVGACHIASRPGISRLALVTNGQRNFARRNFAHQLEQVPFVGLRLLDAELVHVLQRLVVFLAEGHLPLGRLEAHAFHGDDELLGVGAAGLLDRRDHRDARRHAAGGEEVGLRAGEALAVLSDQPVVHLVLREAVVVVNRALDAGQVLPG